MWNSRTSFIALPEPQPSPELEGIWLYPFSFLLLKDPRDAATHSRERLVPLAGATVTCPERCRVPIVSLLNLDRRQRKGQPAHPTEKQAPLPSPGRTSTVQ